MDWAHRFDDSVREVMTAQPLRLLELEKHPDFRMAAPSPDHFLPLVYLAGLAAAGQEAATVLVDGYAYGSLSMASYTVGLDCQELGEGSGVQDLPRAVPTDETNL